jgi:uncharacterized delta-60 repeat protein
MLATFALALAAAGPATASGTPPLDPGFGGSGVVLADFTGGEDGANAVAIDPDGAIVAAGFADLGDPGRPHVAGFGLARYLPDGSPDPAFSGDGRVLVDFGFVNQAARAVAVDSAGRAVATGTITTFDGSTSSIGVVRLLGDGAPDPGFGSGGEVVIQPGTLSMAYDVAIDDEDRVVVIGAATGSRGFRPLVLRFTAEGDLDATFGEGGIAEFGKVKRDSYTSIAFDGRDRLLLAGSSRPRPFGRAVPAVRRMRPSGAFDRSYGEHGLGLPFGRMEGAAAGLAIDPEGRAVATATCDCGRTGDDFALGRLTPRGRADRSFGARGRAVAAFGRRDARPSAVAVDGAGRVVAGGSVRRDGDNDWALARFRWNGERDRSFGNGGRISAALGPGVAGVQGIAVDSESRVLAAGLGTGALGSDFAVARFR